MIVLNPVTHGTAERLDSALSNLPENIHVHFEPGLYETRGYWNGGGWQPRRGQRFTGSGIGNTVIRLVDNDRTGGVNQTSIFGTDYNRNASFFELSDLTLDCNFDGQPETEVNCGAISVQGAGTRISRVRVINFGTLAPTECFAIGLVAGHPDFGPRSDLRVEDCVVDLPSSESIGGGITGIILTGLGNNCVVRNCVVNGNNRVPVMHGITTCMGSAIVEGNYLSGMTDGWYADTGKYGRITVRHNEFLDVIAGVSVNFVDGQKDYVVESMRIMGNTIRVKDDGYGIALNGLNHTVHPGINVIKDSWIEANDIRGGQCGLTLYHTGTAQIRRNRIVSPQTVVSRNWIEAPVISDNVTA